MSPSPTFCLNCSREQGEPVEAGAFDTDREALIEEHDLDEKDRYILLEHDSCGERAINPEFTREDVEEFIETHQILSERHVGNGDMKLNDFKRKDQKVA